MTEMKPAQRLLIALVVAALTGCVTAVGFEIVLEMARYEYVSRDYEMGLWVSDIALLVAVVMAVLFSYLAWKLPEVFRDLILIDFFGWVRGLFKSH